MPLRISFSNQIFVQRRWSEGKGSHWDGYDGVLWRGNLNLVLPSQLTITLFCVNQSCDTYVQKGSARRELKTYYVMGRFASVLHPRPCPSVVRVHIQLAIYMFRKGHSRLCERNSRSVIVKVIIFIMTLLPSSISNGKISTAIFEGNISNYQTVQNTQIQTVRMTVLMKKKKKNV